MIRFLFFILIFLPLFTFAQITGRVVSIADGDTFTMLVDGKKQVKIRLHGIDCPEKGQPYGQDAKSYTGALVFGKIVTAQPTDTDRYGRTIAIVLLQDGRILNEELLKAGLAWHYKRYDQNMEWVKLEAIGISNKRGIWSGKDKMPIAPWEWRKQKAKSKISAD